MSENILEVKNLKISFRTNGGLVKAVRGINFDLAKGETLAIVGESGSGKSVTSKAIMGIQAGNAITESGEILYDGMDLLKVSEEDMCGIRGDKISMIFQDPLSSLNPIVKIGRQITEAMLLKNKQVRKESRAEFSSRLKLVGEYMIKANPDKAARIKEMLKIFEDFNKSGDSLSDSYNQAVSHIVDVFSNAEDYLFRLEHKAKLDSKQTISEIIKGIPLSKNPYLTAGREAELDEIASILRANRNAAPESEELCGAMRRITALQEEINSQEEPDFFRIGYYLINHTQDSSMSNAKLNAVALEALDSEFMQEFLEYADAAVSLAHAEADEGRKQYVDAAPEAKEYFAGIAGLSKADCERKHRELSALVKKSIDRVEVYKDSFAYTFDSSLGHAVDRYFEAKRNNPKEEARFARQTAKREKLIAKGKTVDWKVIPKQVYSLEELSENITDIISRLEKHYKEILADGSFDARKGSIALIDDFKKLSAESVSVLTPGMAKETAIKLMDEVGIPEARIRYNQYPFEFSGGMRQRIVIAIALSANPEILICDEPTTALDVTIQAQILDLINKLKRERGLSIIFITHDLGVVADMADKIAVMYAGKIVEYGTSEDIFYDPRHPYTWALLSSMPDLDTKEKLDAIPGTPPNMIYPPEGDAFAERNKYAMAIDFKQQPPEFRVSDTHWAATWLLHPDAPEVKTPKAITDRIARMKEKYESKGAEADV